VRAQEPGAREACRVIAFIAFWFVVVCIAREGSELADDAEGAAALVQGVGFLLALAAGAVLIGGPGVAFCLWVSR
jgi:hypothetical protein